jgi:hypothetical protein
MYSWVNFFLHVHSFFLNRNNVHSFVNIYPETFLAQIGIIKMGTWLMMDCVFLHILTFSSHSANESAACPASFFSVSMSSVSCWTWGSMLWLEKVFAILNQNIPIYIHRYAWKSTWFIFFKLAQYFCRHISGRNCPKVIITLTLN